MVVQPSDAREKVPFKTGKFACGRNSLHYGIQYTQSDSTAIMVSPHELASKTLLTLLVLVRAMMQPNKARVFVPYALSPSRTHPHGFGLTSTQMVEVDEQYKCDGSSSCTGAWLSVTTDCAYRTEESSYHMQISQF